MSPRSAPAPGRTATGGARSPARGRGHGAGAGLRVRRLARGAGDGYTSTLLPGLHSSEEARRLAGELAFAAARLELLAADPPGMYAEVAAPDKDVEERAWLVFQLVYLCPTDDDDPFAAISAARSDWASGLDPVLEGVQLGPRSAHDPSRGGRTLAAYRAWATRAGSQAAAFTAESGWTPERRFERVYERLALPGLHREARFDLLLTLGSLGVFELRPASLKLGGGGEVTLAAKRAMGIGDQLLLERRCDALAKACGVPLGALDLALYNWGRGERAALGVPAPPDAEAEARISRALGL